MVFAALVDSRFRVVVTRALGVCLDVNLLHQSASLSLNVVSPNLRRPSRTCGPLAASVHALPCLLRCCYSCSSFGSLRDHPESECQPNRSLVHLSLLPASLLYAFDLVLCL